MLWELWASLHTQIWGKVFNTGPRKICGTQDLETWRGMDCLKRPNVELFFHLLSRYLKEIGNWLFLYVFPGCYILFFFRVRRIWFLNPGVPFTDNFKIWIHRVIQLLIFSQYAIGSTFLSILWQEGMDSYWRGWGALMNTVNRSYTVWH